MYFPVGHGSGIEHIALNTRTSKFASRHSIYLTFSLVSMPFTYSKSRESTPARLHSRQPGDSKGQYFEPFNTTYAHPGLRPRRSIERPTTSSFKREQPSSPRPASSHQTTMPRSRLPAVNKHPETRPGEQKPVHPSKEPLYKPLPNSFTRSQIVSDTSNKAVSGSTFVPPSNWHTLASRSHTHTHRSSSAPSRPHHHSGDTSDGSTAISVDLKSLWSKPARPSTAGSMVPAAPDPCSENGPTWSGCYQSGPSPASTSTHMLDDDRENNTRSSKASSRLQEAWQAKERRRGLLPKPLEALSFISRHSLGSPICSVTPVISSPDTKSMKRPHALTTTPAAPVVMTSNPTANVLKRRSTAPDLAARAALQTPPRPGVPRDGNSSLSSVSSDDSLSSLSALTPAGAVAEAYKHRRDLTMGSQDIDHEPREGGESGEPEGHTPYYTVFGSTTGKLVPVGGPDDDAWKLNIDTYMTQGEHSRSTKSTKSTPLRTLSRKASFGWKKVARGGSDGNPAERSLNDVVDGPTTWPSPQRVSPISADKNNRSLRATVDHSGPKGVKSEDGAGGRASASEPSVGGKLWKLVKRISTGGLRDKYNETAPPPVPPIPQDAIFRHDPTTREDGRHGNSPLSTPRSSASAAPVRASMQEEAHVPVPVPPRPSTSTKSSPGPRHSTTTRSSSPLSSDVASSRFFNKTQSVRSSSSSYGESPPPVPSLVGQHIVPPSELYRLNQDHEDRVKSPKIRIPKPPPSNQMDDWFMRSPDEERPSLPLPPPRRPGDGPKDGRSDRRPSSPVIPTFSKVNPINAFKVAKPSLTVATPTSLAPSPRTPTTTLAHKSFADHHADGDACAKHMNSHHNHSNASTLKPRMQSESPADTRPTSKRPPLTFRELGTAEMTVLTERQKADKWNDLLERSARAGGTLHVRADVRVSDYAGDN